MQGGIGQPFLMRFQHAGMAAEAGAPPDLGRSAPAEIDFTECAVWQPEQTGA